MKFSILLFLAIVGFGSAGVGHKWEFVSENINFQLLGNILNPLLSGTGNDDDTTPELNDDLTTPTLPVSNYQLDDDPTIPTLPTTRRPSLVDRLLGGLIVQVSGLVRNKESLDSVNYQFFQLLEDIQENIPALVKILEENGFKNVEAIKNLANQLENLLGALSASIAGNQ
ncbi:hypothetical protein B9Z55_003212 [Caenorhabditis nigoni]|uniref:SXP/RAL-2 family protein Ani s 5-like cation-binding domain-containing protein n=1 Tax=Caenorhabditis nigoni TaxID=1611254 RepID=A0A2G5VP63_9PELO|nr:hypothetical protein B9Z55_003212 [Caenorhabditis nigoni]